MDRIRQIYSSDMGKELIKFSGSSDRYGFTAEGFATNANYNNKQMHFILFINHRCVENNDIKKSFEEMYKMFLPKGTHPFVYLSLEINPQSVDVNVHPTKREVKFENENEIVRIICEELGSRLAAVDTSRTFMTQTLLPGVKVTTISPQPDAAGTPVRETPGTGRKRRNSNSLVRTDTSVRKITSMFPSAQVGGAKDEGARGDSQASPEDIAYEMVDRERTPCRLTSVRELRGEVRDQMHHELTEIIAGHIFVGIVDESRRLAAIQGGVKLFLIDYGHACYEYFYQLGLTNFGNFGRIRFKPPLDLRELLTLAAETDEAAQKDTSVNTTMIVEAVADQLIERREMLAEYFSLEISPAGDLISIPLMVKGYTPPLVKLPRFLLRLGPAVDWTEERPCFETLLREIAQFYVPEQLPALPGNDESISEENIDPELRERRKHVRWAVENVFFPAFKARLLATNSLMKDGVMEAADLKGLYRVFERC
jgi:DNA mismatch repair protein MLH1